MSAQKEYRNDSLPSHADEMPKKQQELIAKPPESFQDKVEALTHTKEFPYIAFVVVILLLWKFR